MTTIDGLTGRALCAHISTKLRLGHALDDEERQLLADVLEELGRGGDAGKLLGTARLRRGNPTYPETLDLRNREVCQAMIATCLRDKAYPEEAKQKLANSELFADPRSPFMGGQTHRKPLSAKSIETIWGASTTQADRDILKSAVDAMRRAP